MKHMLKKTTLLAVAGLFLAALLVASCDTLDSDDDAITVPPSGEPCLLLSVSSTASRTALPQVVAASEFDSFTLTGTGTDANSNVLTLDSLTYTKNGAASAYDVMQKARIPITKGTWTFTLTAIKGGASYGGTLSGVTISEGTNSLSFTLSLTSFDLENGRGDIQVTVSYPADTVAKVTAGLYTTGRVLVSGYEDEAVSSDGKAVFAKANVPAGTYMVVFQFYAENDVPLYVFREYAQVADSLTSISNRTISNMETPYSITYHMNDGSFAPGSNAPATYASNAPATYARRSGDITLPVLVRTGYHFGGWYTDADFTQPLNVIASGSAGNLVVWAKWIPVTYIIRFEKNADSGVSGMTQDLVATYDKSDALTTNGYVREGYAFVKWTEKEDGTGATYANAESSVWNLATEQDDVVTLYAEWKVSDAKYTIRHFLQNIENDSYTEDTSARQLNVGGVTDELTTATPLTTYQGFTPQLPVQQKKVASDDSTVVDVYYDRNSYTLSYEQNAYVLSGDKDTSVSALPNAESRRYQLEKAVSATLPTRTGYEFAKWNTQKNGGGTDYAPASSLTMAEAADITLYAQWTANTYTVTFNGNHGATESGAETTSQTMTYDTYALLNENTFTRAGYAFDGWTQYADGTGSSWENHENVVNLTATNGGAVTMFAKWKEADTTYTVEHYQQNASGVGYALVSTDTESKGGKTGELTDAKTRTYIGFTPRSFSQEAIQSDGSTVIKIYYDRSPYTLSFDATTGTGTMGSQTFYYGISQALNANQFTRTGYSFEGWATESTGLFVYLNEATYTIDHADATLYATWSPNTYTVTLSANDATEAGTESVTATYDSAMPAIAKLPAREGYTFAGFYTESNGSGTQYYTAAGESMRTWDIASDTTLYAHWVVAGTRYTVRHYLQNTDLATYTLSDEYTQAGTTGEATAAAAKTSYAGFVIPSVTQETIAADGSTVVEIKYHRNTYTLSFDKHDGTGTMESQTLYYGVSTAIKPNEFTRTGYSFAGWATSSTGEKSYNNAASYTIGSDNATLYALWSPNTYAVTLSANDATEAGTATVTATYDSNMPSIAKLPAREGYTFAGFFTEAGGNGTQYYTAAGESARTWNLAANTTLYAHWTAQINTAYKVEHYQQNTSGDSSADYTLYETDTKTGTTGASTAATAHTYTGFNAPTITQSTISADGSTVVRLYYTRKTFTVTYTAGSGISSGVTGIPAAETYRYGKAVLVATATPTRSGYAFNGWNLGADTTTIYRGGDTVSTGITANLTLSANWSKSGAISLDVGNPDLVSASKDTSGKVITLTLNGAAALDATLTLIDGTAATGKTGVSVSANKLICDTTTWAAGSYQVILAAMVNSVLQTANATIIVE